MKRSWIERIPDHTPEWYARRQNGLGASEIGILLGLSKYRPTNMELWHFKVGTEKPPQFDNEAMFHGRGLEDYVANIWQYWDNNGASYVDNYNKGEVIRKCRKLVGFVTNPKYPHLFTNLDRVMEIGSPMMREAGGMSDEMTEEMSPLEIKNMSKYVTDMWEGGIPINYTIQVQQQLLITEAKYAEIAYLVDGRNLNVRIIEPDKDLQDMIITRSTEFWESVEAGRHYFEIYKNARSEAEKQDAMGMIQMLEPEPDGSEAYKEYLSEKHQREYDEVLASDDIAITAAKHRAYQALRKEVEALEEEQANRLRYFMNTQKAERATVPGKGYFRVYARKGSTNLTLDNRTEKPDELKVRKLAETLDISCVINL